MLHTKMVALPFLVSELLPFYKYFIDYPCVHHNSETKMKYLNETA